MNKKFCFIFIIIILIFLLSCSKPTSQISSQYQDIIFNVEYEGKIPLYEKVVWNEFANIISSIYGKDGEIYLKREEDIVSINFGTDTYSALSPYSLSLALVSIAKKIFKIENNISELPLSLELIDSVLSDEMWNQITPSSSQTVSEMREGALQSAVLAFYFQSEDGAFPSQQLAARSFVLDAIACARTGDYKEDKLLKAFQTTALGRPDEALKLLENINHHTARYFEAYLKTATGDIPENNTVSDIIFNILTKRRDKIVLKPTDLEKLNNIAPNALFPRIVIARFSDVSLQHFITIDTLSRTLVRGEDILRNRYSREKTKNSISSFDVCIALPDYKPLLVSYADALNNNRNNIDELLVNIAEGWLHLVIHTRFDFLLQRYSHEPSANEFSNQLIKILGYTHPAVAYNSARKSQPQSEKIDIYAETILNLPDRSRFSNAIRYLKTHHRKNKVNELYNILEKELDDYDIVKLRRIINLPADCSKDKEKFYNLYHTAKKIDPYDPEIYVYRLTSEEDINEAVKSLPQSYAMALKKETKLINRLIKDEGKVENAIEYLKSISKILPNETDILRRIAWFSMTIGKHEEASEYWQLWFEKYPHKDLAYSHSLSQYGINLFEMGKKEEAISKLKMAAKSYAARPMKYYAAALQAMEKYDLAEDIFKRIYERYPTNYRHWISLAVFYDRINKSNKADDIFIKEIPNIIKLKQKNVLFKELLFKRPERIIWLYENNLFKLDNGYDDGYYAIANVLTGNMDKALKILSDGETAKRFMPATIWLHYAIIAREKGIQKAKEYILRQVKHLNFPDYHKDIIAVINDEVKPGDILQSYSKTQYHGTFTNTLYPIVAITWKYENRDNWQHWMHHSLRLSHSEYYLPILIRVECGYPAGDWFVVGSERAKKIIKSGLPFYY